jgi:hypothetical protein
MCKTLLLLPDQASKSGTYPLWFGTRLALVRVELGKSLKALSNWEIKR